jgi:betaine-aldehyde dehydrogenase
MQEIRADRRQHIIASAICVLAENGIVEFTFNKVAHHAGISAALIVHYFASKEALLEAAFRSVVRQLNNQATARLRLAAGPRARIQALVDSHLGHNDFSEETARVWLSFWGQALHVPQLARVQRAHQQRMLSNLKFDLRQLVDAREVSPMADTIAAMVDGVWLRAAMNGGSELQNGLARDLIFEFIARNLKDTLPSRAATSFDTVNPATGQLLATIRIDGQAEVDKAVARAAEAQKLWAKTPGVERGRILHRAAALLVERNDVLARLEAQDTGKPIQETIAVDVLSGADCIEYYAGLARTIAGEHHDLGTGAFGYSRREP